MALAVPMSVCGGFESSEMLWKKITNEKIKTSTIFPKTHKDFLVF